MLDRGMTAGLLEERLMLVEKEMPEDKLLPAAMRSAIRHMKEKEISLMYTAEEVAGFAGILKTGAEIACYLERKGYYKPEGCIVYAASPDTLFLSTSVGSESMALDRYNRDWRLWAQYPDGMERHKRAWDGAEIK